MGQGDGDIGVVRSEDRLKDGQGLMERSACQVEPGAVIQVHASLVQHHDGVFEHNLRVLGMCGGHQDVMQER
ncbi:MAG: hypothetical protein ACRDYA_15310 [Egibacteraceae bacterium]